MISDENAARLTIESALKRIAAYREELSTVMLGMPAAAGDRLLATIDRIIGEQAIASDIAKPERQDRPRDLRERVDQLQRELTELSERVRISDVADAFLRGEHPIAAGDYFLLDHGTPTKLLSISHEGKWTYFDGRQVIEPFRVPRPDQYERLYTQAEVAEILAKVP